MWLWVTRLTLLMLQVNLVRPNGDTIRTYLNIHNHMQKLRRARARVNRYAPDTVHKSGPDSVKFAKAPAYFTFAKARVSRAWSIQCLELSDLA